MLAGDAALQAGLAKASRERRHQMDAVREQRDGYLGSCCNAIPCRHMRGDLEGERRVHAMYVEGHSGIAAKDDDVASDAANRILVLAARGTFATMHHDVGLRHQPVDPVAGREAGRESALDLGAGPVEPRSFLSARRGAR